MLTPNQVKSHARRFVRSVYRSLRPPPPQHLAIGPHRIQLAANSQLANYRRTYHLYDTALGKIAGVLKTKYPDLHAIDIGANVGDTAALIRESEDIPVLCIEGDPQLLALLKENVAGLGTGVEIEASFVGPDAIAVDLESVRDLGNNACLVDAVGTQGAVRCRSLNSILLEHPEFRNSKLVKTDTEGFDFKIIKDSLCLFRQSRPAVFFEYDPHFSPTQPREGLETIEALIVAGYSEFIYYDNCGNFLLHAGAGNTALFEDLDCYLWSNRRHGTVVYYFDVCALHQEDRGLVRPIKALTQI